MHTDGLKVKMGAPLAGSLLLLLSLATLSCARLVAPAELQTGPTPTPAVQPSPAAHPVIREQECLVCHGSEERFLASLETGHPVPIPPGNPGGASEGCVLCHAGIAAGPVSAPPMPHGARGMEKCLTCHSGGATSIPVVPPNHTGYPIEKCTLCHVPPTAQAGLPEPSPQPAKGPSAIPHGVAGMENCTACH